MQVGSCNFGCVIRLVILPEEPFAMLLGTNKTSSTHLETSNRKTQFRKKKKRQNKQNKSSRKDAGFFTHLETSTRQTKILEKSEKVIGEMIGYTSNVLCINVFFSISRVFPLTAGTKKRNSRRDDRIYQ